jgi:hypothetical protein
MIQLICYHLRWAFVHLREWTAQSSAGAAHAQLLRGETVRDAHGTYRTYLAHIIRINHHMHSCA